MDLYEGINTLLNSIGEIPITDNTQAQAADATSDVGIARDTLLRVSRAIQEEGWWFNKELEYPLVPNTGGYIAISDSILGIYDDELIIKDHKLYSTSDRSYIFESTQSIDVVFNISFDDLPFVVSNFITSKAAVQFYSNILGDTQELATLQTTAGEAAIAFQKAQLKHRKANLMSGSRLLNRTQNPTALS